MIDIQDISETTLVLQKPGRVKRFIGVTIIFVVLAGLASYLITDGFNVAIHVALKRFSFLAMILLPFWLYDFWCFRRDIDVTIVKIEKDIYSINGALFDLNPSDHYIGSKVNGNRFGGSLYSIYIVGDKDRKHIASRLSKDEYTVATLALCKFLNLSRFDDSATIS